MGYDVENDTYASAWATRMYAEITFIHVFIRMYLYSIYMYTYTHMSI